MYNKVTLIGRLGRNPETRYAASGDAVCNFSVATSETWKDKQTNEKVEKTEWHNITTFGKLAEICQQFLHKGSQVFIEGRIQTDKYTDKVGVEKYATKIICNNMKMLGSKTDTAQELDVAKPAVETQGSAPDFDDDIPF